MTGPELEFEEYSLDAGVGVAGDGGALPVLVPTGVRVTALLPPELARADEPETVVSELSGRGVLPNA